MRYFILLLFASAIFFGLVPNVNACSCGPKPTVLDAFDSSDEVVVGKVTSIGKAPDSQKEHYQHGIRSTTVLVERVFKGNLKVNEEIVFAQGGGADCIWTFHSTFVGTEFLFYLKRLTSESPAKEEAVWMAFTCGRSTLLDGATEDLLYLENLDKLRGKTRISGKLRGSWNVPDIDADGKLIRLIGPDQKTYQTRTDQNGVFEIYDLPPGNYLIEPEVPAGWTFSPYMKLSSSGMDHTLIEKTALKPQPQVPIVLEPKKHTRIDIVLVIHNFVRGRVVGPTAKPLKGVCLYLLMAGKDDSSSFDCTDEQGQFEIKSVPQGEYVLVANKNDKLSEDEPFRKIFYPGVFDRERAATLNIGPGQTIDNVDLVVPKLEETITISGVVRYSDGKPVVDEIVTFTATKDSEKVASEVDTTTNKKGRFTMKVVKGLTGELAAEKLFSPGTYKSCPKLDELLAKSGTGDITVRSNVIPITTQQNLYRVELTLPIPRCEVVEP